MKSSEKATEKKPPERGFSEARNETRTRDPFLTMEVLYQLSYPGRSRSFPRGSQGTILEGIRGSGAAVRRRRPGR